MRTIFSTVAATMAMGLLMFVNAQPPQGKGGAKAPPKNLKILTAENYFPAMQGFVAGLGLADKGGCNFCHEADRSSDAKMEKVMARAMLEMVNGINANMFKGEQKVTCYTCHRGTTMPLKAAPAAN
ncbi:MAG: photosynthetic reaction center cytochrome c subunit family protein [Acidobacteriota bacterium]